MPAVTPYLVVGVVQEPDVAFVVLSAVVLTFAAVGQSVAEKLVALTVAVFVIVQAETVKCAAVQPAAVVKTAAAIINLVDDPFGAAFAKELVFALTAVAVVGVALVAAVGVK